ncbi:hypothetical protein Rumeso_01354 [Rubellimicrobium mesophilum DSM 19309]|uniref:Uncharacterized protein n=1 Tax=Rubellimicrobium mesophilum DSM 19309 TaxID=442562 RepID=A0A017HS10_9RHOB|nr:hypothetical protein [Rubellimicrobium mesophilum]EYD77095.1 hypothetical protein Rumeso_01354 [Rubellimicrobium mesophilum DSM 19309]
MPAPHRIPVLSAADVEQDLTDALNLLRSVRRTLQRLLDRAEHEEDPGALKDIGLKHSELESALRRAYEAEERYNAWAAKTTGVQNACEIDFDALREDIACRLQRLRDCCEEA